MENINENRLNNDVLGEIYLAKKHVEGLEELFRTEKDIYYLLEKEVILCYPKNEKDTSFKISNLEFKESPSDPTLEILVIPETTELYFLSTNVKESKIRFKASFDKYSKDWDVRSYMNGKNVPSYLQDSLDELLTIPNGEIEKEGFSNMIESVRKVFKKSREKKLKK